MARKKSKIVKSSWKGIPTVRSKPDKVNHTAPSIRSYNIFGMAANRSAEYRKLLAAVIPNPKSKDIQHGLQTAFQDWLHTGPLENPAPVDEVPFINGFSLNEKNELKAFLKFPILTGRSTNGQLEMKLPAFDPTLQIKAPAATKALQLKVALAAMQLNNLAYQDAQQIKINMPFEPGIRPAEVIALPIDTGPGKLSLVALAIRYFTGPNEQGLEDKLEWKPAGIVGSFYN